MKNVDGNKFLLPGVLNFLNFKIFLILIPKLFDQNNRILTELIINAFAEEICQKAPLLVQRKLYDLLRNKSERVILFY